MPHWATVPFSVSPNSDSSMASFIAANSNLMLIAARNAWHLGIVFLSLARKRPEKARKDTFAAFANGSTCRYPHSYYKKTRIHTAIIDSNNFLQVLSRVFLVIHKLCLESLEYVLIIFRIDLLLRGYFVNFAQIGWSLNDFLSFLLNHLFLQLYLFLELSDPILPSRSNILKLLDLLG